MKSPLLMMAASILLVSVLLGLLVLFDVHESLLDLLRWVDDQGVWAAALFIVLMALVIILILPGVLFTTGAGFVFGVFKGTLYVIAGSVLGAAVAFLIARHLFGERARRFIMHHSRLHVVTDEMAAHDFKVVLLTRLVPFFPGKISNYFFGLTNFSFRGFLLGSLVGFIPYSLHNVYLGSLAASLVTLGEREIGRTPVEWGIYALGFVATVVAVVFLTRLAREALAKYSPEVSEEDLL